MKKYYKIAGLTVQMESFGRTVEQAAPYEIEPVEKADVVIENAPSEYINKYSYLSPSECEYIYTGMSFYKQLINYGGIMLHSSAVVVDGRAYLFTAASGTGKSTHTAFWRKALSGHHDIVMVNDDKPLIRVMKQGVFACGSPWSGTYGLNTDVSLPVRAICVLHRAVENQIEPLAKNRVFAELYQRVYLPPNAEGTQRVLAMLNQTIHFVSFWSLGCNMTEEAALTAYHAMKKGDNK